MLVIAVLAVVATMAVVRTTSITRNARITAAVSDAMELARAFADYQNDMRGLAGFSPALSRVGNLFVSTNVFGTIMSEGVMSFVRLDAFDVAGCAHAQEFTTWSEARQRGWHGAYLRNVTLIPFPARTAEATSRGFYPDVRSLRLPSRFSEHDASVYGFAGEMTMADPWGNPFVLQVPPPQAFTNVLTVTEQERFKFARIVSAGPDGVLQTPCFFVNATNQTATTWSLRNQRLARQAGLIKRNGDDEADMSERGDDIVFFLNRTDTDETTDPDEL